MKLLVDTNVAVDLLLLRDPWASESKILFDEAAIRGAQLCMSAVSLTTLFYLVKKEKDGATALICVDRAIEALTLLSVDASMLLRARSMVGKDFEDNVQAACADAAGCDYIVTRNLADFKASLVPAIAPSDAIAKIRLAYPD